MEYLVEFLLELVLEGSIEVSKSPKIRKPIRRLFLIIIALFFLFTIGIILFTGILVIKENQILGFLLLLLGFLILTLSIIKFKEMWKKK